MVILTKIHKRGYQYWVAKEQPKSPRKEDTEQIEFVAWFKHNYPIYPIWHTVNEVRSKSAAYHEKQRRKGKRKGVSDILIYIDGILIAVEMKRASIKASTPVTDEQISFLNDVLIQGGQAAVCYGSDAAKEFIINCLK